LSVVGNFTGYGGSYHAPNGTTRDPGDCAAAAALRRRYPVPESPAIHPDHHARRSDHVVFALRPGDPLPGRGLLRGLAEIVLACVFIMIALSIFRKSLAAVV